MTINTGTPTLTGRLSTDTLALSSGFNIGAAGVFTLSGATPSTINGGTLTIANTGAMLLTGAGGLLMNNGGALSISAGGLLDFQSNASILWAGGLPIPTVANSGTVRKSAGAGTSDIGFGVQAVSFTNLLGGTIAVQTGTLQAGSNFTSNSGTINVATGTTFATNNTSFANNGVLSGNGTINVGIGTVTNNGTISPGASPGALAITGNLTMGPLGVVDIQIQAPGLSAGTHYDLLTVSGLASLGGTLNITNLSGFVAPAGLNPQILSYGSRSGDFTATNFLGGANYTATPGATFYQLVASGGVSSGSSSASSSSTTSAVINTVVSEQSRMQQTTPNDEGENKETKKPLAAAQCT